MSGLLTSKELGALLDEQGAALENYARQWTRSPEDCVQEAFVKLASQNPPPEHRVPWLYRVVRNLAINDLRADQRRREHETNRAKDFGEQPDLSEDFQQLNNFLTQLPDQQREIVTLRIWGRLKWEEVADVTGLSTSHAHRLYKSGIEKLQTLWGNYV